MVIKEYSRKILSKLGYHTKPNFIIIGAQKAGTTGLFFTLKKHNFVDARIKEIHYFDNDDWYYKGNLDEYHACFPAPHNTAQNTAIFEATPIYLYHPEVAKRLFDYNPKLKLIVILRNPADRALSAWTMYNNHFKKGKESIYYDSRSFADAIEEEIKNLDTLDFYQNRKGYVSRGIYVDQLARYFNYFSKEKILILENREIFDMKESVSKKIQSFIDVDYQPLKPIQGNKARVNIKSEYQKEILRLKEFYKPHNEELYKLIGRSFDWNDG